ncbi:MAG: NAD(P)-binding domain-containing protein [Dysgonamonadaceae bacterium]|jgi:glycerol-3-phosphate dehydrogenase (NAD(P)+)|nr:NAD(P)-binding domain-containing protein [Dysgonamonadaceae bacterium]MDD3357101.1 NAD(P)-binding domain-containing protein [Dysgonamonadaceae bacterium]MDD3728487.1 NAD(P)-binding domain-containing protein [Dysgonamonadaceae bacterium]MDD4247355.1 NAD(P)-binding domain-containing protein [Dysgonamonadaceae bacterium]MDD4606272.1 NAD(P)-binding domain-containing protein [Dysgonamonadaceae bacterium]
MDSPGKIAIIGSGTWATALAKIVLMKNKHLNWFIRKSEVIDEFYKLGHNPSYLSNVKFNLSQISFSSNIERTVKDSDTIIIAVPSPYLKQHLRKLKTSAFQDKLIFSAVKGIVPFDNMVVSEYLAFNYKMQMEDIGIISGPCHAEEVALERLSFLTVACKDIGKATIIADAIRSRILSTSVSTDVIGIELAAVLKNIYAIVSGICSALQYGDNFQAVLMSYSAQEMERFIQGVLPLHRNILETHYLGDMLVTGYSQFSRNRTLGTMIGRGYSVKTAQLEMEMVTEGYYATKCIKEMNNRFKIDIPIVEIAYDILYNNVSPRIGIRKLVESLR